MARSIVLFFALAATACGPRLTLPPGTVQVNPSPRVVLLWHVVLACAENMGTGKLEDVKWYRAPHNSLTDSHGDTLAGYWFPPNRVVLDSVWADTVWVVAHELMHHRLRGPPDNKGGPHPWFPFAFPCQLMPFQHTPGGLMGKGRHL